MCPAWNERDEHGIDRFTADPSLNAEPAAGYEGAQNRGNVRAKHAERSAREHWKWNSVLRAGMSVEQHRDQHKDVTEKNGEQRLLPVHAARNHAACEHVGGNVHAHRDPEGGVVVRAPGAAFPRDRSEIFVVERARADGFRS